jgi:Antibiotic biosynthesis monooxygenase.
VFARLHILKTTPEQHDRGLEIIREQLLPHLRGSSGFRGLIRLDNRDDGKTLVITLWADEEALQASRDAAEQFSTLTAETSGATRLALEHYEATFFDVAS